MYINLLPGGKKTTQKIREHAGNKWVLITKYFTARPVDVSAPGNGQFNKDVLDGVIWM